MAKNFDLLKLILFVGDQTIEIILFIHVKFLLELVLEHQLRLSMELLGIQEFYKVLVELFKFYLILLFEGCLKLRLLLSRKRLFTLEFALFLIDFQRFKEAHKECRLFESHQFYHIRF